VHRPALPRTGIPSVPPALPPPGTPRVARRLSYEWALANGGDLPTVGQLTATGDVGLAHAWWPTNPFLGIKMAPGSGIGSFIYAPGDDGTFSVTVNLVATDLYPATYTAK